MDGCCVLRILHETPANQISGRPGSNRRPPAWETAGHVETSPHWHWIYSSHGCQHIAAERLYNAREQGNPCAVCMEYA
jgi:hypothetical protein